MLPCSVVAVVVEREHLVTKLVEGENLVTLFEAHSGEKSKMKEKTWSQNLKAQGGEKSKSKEKTKSQNESKEKTLSQKESKGTSCHKMNWRRFFRVGNPIGIITLAKG